MAYQTNCKQRNRASCPALPHKARLLTTARRERRNGIEHNLTPAGPPASGLLLSLRGTCIIRVVLKRGHAVTALPALAAPSTSGGSFRPNHSSGPHHSQGNVTLQSDDSPPPPLLTRPPDRQLPIDTGSSSSRCVWDAVSDISPSV